MWVREGKKRVGSLIGAYCSTFQQRNWKEINNIHFNDTVERFVKASRCARFFLLSFDITEEKCTDVKEIEKRDEINRAK